MPSRSPTAVQAVGWALGLAALAAAPAAAPQADAREIAAPAAVTLAMPLVVAHRGASGHAPENTLAAVDAAADLDTEWVEVDVQRSADGELFLMHDTTLERTTDAAERFPDRAPWRVADFTAEEIARLDAGRWFAADFAGEPVPTLADCLDRLAANGQRLLLELKVPERYPGIEKEVLAELASQGWLDEDHPGQRLVVQSFDADALRAVHEQAPEVKLAFLGSPALAKVHAYAEFADQINPSHTDLTAGYVAGVQSVLGPHGAPLEVQTWTVNDAPAVERVAELGVDGIITNHPGMARDALRG